MQTRCVPTYRRQQESAHDRDHDDAQQRTTDFRAIPAAPLPPLGTPTIANVHGDQADSRVLVQLENQVKPLGVGSNKAFNVVA
jgi:hypothetical protein